MNPNAEMLIGGQFFGGPCDQSISKTAVRSPWDGQVIGTAAEGTFHHLNAAHNCAQEAFQSWSRTGTWEREELLRRVAAKLRTEKSALARILALEIGKPIHQGLAEVERAALTFETAATLVSRMQGEPAEKSLDPRAQNHTFFIRREPIGVIFAITPYNWPVNLAAHKIAPAIASGNAIVVKPSPAALLSSFTFGRLLHESGVPDGLVNFVSAEVPDLTRFFSSPRFQMLSFTGSPEVGWKLANQLPRHIRVTLELGGDATAYVSGSADLATTLPKLIQASFAYAGQICISLQHILVAPEIREKVETGLTTLLGQIVSGDPENEDTLCGPMISPGAADKVENWTSELIDSSGPNCRKLGGERTSTTRLRPALILDPDPTAPVYHREAFGPVATLTTCETLDRAIEIINASPFGIHASIFTSDEMEASRFAREVQTAGVLVNEPPSFRLDSLPYGGRRESGIGREGVWSAIESMTEIKSIALHGLEKLPGF